MLTERGFDWFSHYSAVDPIHEFYGIEVCGIHDEQDAKAIMTLLVENYPDWSCRSLYHAEDGWQAVIQYYGELDDFLGKLLDSDDDE